MLTSFLYGLNDHDDYALKGTILGLGKLSPIVPASKKNRTTIYCLNKSKGFNN